MQKAIGYYEQALEINRAASDQHAESKTLSRLRAAYNQLDAVKQAVEYYKEP